MQIVLLRWTILGQRFDGICFAFFNNSSVGSLSEGSSVGEIGQV